MPVLHTSVGVRWRNHSNDYSNSRWILWGNRYKCREVVQEHQPLQPGDCNDYRYTGTISASGSTTICDGSRWHLHPVLVQIICGHWWETTQSITVSAAGSYEVTVTGGCAGTSLPTVVTVNPNPTSICCSRWKYNILSGRQCSFHCFRSFFLCMGTRWWNNTKVSQLMPMEPMPLLSLMPMDAAALMQEHW